MRIILEKIRYEHLTKKIDVLWTIGEARFRTIDTWTTYPKLLTPEQILSLYPAFVKEGSRVFYRASSKLSTQDIIENNDRYNFPENVGGEQFWIMLQHVEKIAGELFYANTARLLYIGDQNSFMLNEIELEIASNDEPEPFRFFSPLASPTLSSSPMLDYEAGDFFCETSNF